MVLQYSRPGAHASVRNIRVSAFKARPVLRLIQGQSYEEALEILKFCDRGAADVIVKCLRSAAANAEHNDGIDPEETFVSSCFADEGPTIRRWRPRARGRATRIHKRTCHITIQLERYTPVELAEMTARESSASSASAEARRRRVAASRGEENLDDEVMEGEVVDEGVVDEEVSEDEEILEEGLDAGEVVEEEVLEDEESLDAEENLESEEVVEDEESPGEVLEGEEVSDMPALSQAQNDTEKQDAEKKEKGEDS